MTKEMAMALELLGTIVYYNRWTGFESKEIGVLFEPVSHEQAAKLEKGATVWIDTDWPSGKVYGFSRAEITSVVDDGHDVTLAYKGPRIQGGARIGREFVWNKVHLCTDDNKLLELVAKLPLATEPGTVGTISETSRAYLEAQGATIVRA